jgi:hypothetical protein
MHQKVLALQAWRETGLDRHEDPKIQAFFKLVQASSGACWPDLVKECRNHLPDQKRLLAIPVWKTGDKLLRVNLLRFLDPAHKDELMFLLELVRHCDATKDGPELRAVVEKRHKQLLHEVERKTGLSNETQLLIRAYLPLAKN